MALFGALRGGIVAALYNGVLGALLMAMGYALAARKAWALQATAAASVGYTLDKMLFVIDGQARAASLGDSPQLLDAVGVGMGSKEARNEKGTGHLTRPVKPIQV